MSIPRGKKDGGDNGENEEDVNDRWFKNDA
jgi:hypothetical protein